MRRCLELALKGQPHPNPYVGAVAVSESGKIIAEGYHRKAGEEHAEAEVLCKFSAKGSKLYINLEPCCYIGRVSPCTDAIIASGIKKVAVAMKDPNPKVNGKGIAALRRAGIDVTVGVLEKEAIALNEQFVTFHTKRRPFISLKFAATLDGKIATRTGDSRWITSDKMRAYTRALRARHQAILVGINTVIADDPHLGVRTRGDSRDPIRVILDSKLRIQKSAKVLRDNNVIIATTPRATEKKIKALEGLGITVWVCRDKGRKVSITDLVKRMRAHNIISCFVEGGASISSAFFNARLVDKVYWAIAPKILGDEKALSAVSGNAVALMKHATALKNVHYTQIDDNILLSGYVL